MTNLLFPCLAISTGFVFGAYSFLRTALALHLISIAGVASTSHAYGRYLGHLPPPLAKEANGVVLDIGPGDGQNLGYYIPENITKLYLVEPCAGLHSGLRGRVKKAGLEEVATVIACGVRDVDIIEAQGITSTSIDTIVTLSVLYSVPAPGDTCRFLSSHLKSGGQWLLVEGVLADQKYPISRWIQGGFQLPRPILIGGCNTTVTWRSM